MWLTGKLGRAALEGTIFRDVTSFNIKSLRHKRIGYVKNFIAGAWTRTGADQTTVWTLGQTAWLFDIWYWLAKMKYIYRLKHLFTTNSPKMTSEVSSFIVESNMIQTFYRIAPFIGRLFDNNSMQRSTCVFIQLCFSLLQYSHYVCF